LRSGSNGIYGCPVTVVHNGQTKTIQIVLDTPEARELITAYETKTAEINHALAMEPRTLEYQRGQITPGRTAFLAAMAGIPHVMVKETTRCKMLEISKAPCSPLAEATVTYVKAIITTGDSKGQQVWICRDPYSLPFESP
jgi:hypothetical protein